MILILFIIIYIKYIYAKVLQQSRRGGYNDIIGLTHKKRVAAPGGFDHLGSNMSPSKHSPRYYKNISEKKKNLYIQDYRPPSVAINGRRRGGESRERYIQLSPSEIRQRYPQTQTLNEFTTPNRKKKKKKIIIIIMDSLKVIIYIMKLMVLIVKLFNHLVVNHIFN